MTTETGRDDGTGAAYRVRLDRDACDGIFACLVRDDRFVEGADGLASLDGTVGGSAPDETPAGAGESVAVFEDDRLEDARQAARACPVGAIEVTRIDGGANEVEVADE